MSKQRQRDREGWETRRGEGGLVLCLDYVRAASLGWEVKRDPLGAGWGLPGGLGGASSSCSGAVHVNWLTKPIYCRARVSVIKWMDSIRIAR